jgi:hypothetical protein
MTLSLRIEIVTSLNAGQPHPDVNNPTPLAARALPRLTAGAADCATSKVQGNGGRGEDPIPGVMSGREAIKRIDGTRVPIPIQ